MKLRKQMAAAVLAAAALSLSLPLSQAQDTPSPDHMLGLTAEQRMEDYKYLWSVLADSYPCWGILDREGVDVEGIYTSYRDMVAESDSDQTFYQAVYSTLFLLGNNGHLSIVEPADYFSLLPSVSGAGRRPGPTFSSGKRPAKSTAPSWPWTAPLTPQVRKRSRPWRRRPPLLAA